MLAYEDQDGEAGFTLVEAVVAFVIAAAALTLLLESFAGSLAGQRLSGGYATAALLAESKLAESGTLLVEGRDEAEGEAAGGYRWQVVRSPYNAEAARFSNVPLAPYEITARVTWRDGGRERAVTLSTLRLQRRSGPDE